MDLAQNEKLQRRAREHTPHDVLPEHTHTHYPRGLTHIQRQRLSRLLRRGVEPAKGGGSRRIQNNDVCYC
jgi:hypothetical protein